MAKKKSIKKSKNCVRTVFIGTASEGPFSAAGSSLDTSSCILPKTRIDASTTLVEINFSCGSSLCLRTAHSANKPPVQYILSQVPRMPKRSTKNGLWGAFKWDSWVRKDVSAALWDQSHFGYGGICSYASVEEGKGATMYSYVSNDSLAKTGKLQICDTCAAFWQI